MKILMGAYACEPDRGSEPGAGWAWACAAARDHEVWVLTHGTNEESVTSAIRADRHLCARLHPVFLRNPKWLRPLRRKGPTRFLYYIYWQLVTCPRAAKRLHDKVGFDVAHHVTYASDWLPAGVSRLREVPFVWGPVGGASTRGDLRLARRLGARTFLSETARTASLTVARATTGRRLARRAAAVLGQNRDVAHAFAPVPVTVEPNIVLTPRPEQATRSASQSRAVFAGRLLGWKGMRLALEALGRPEASEWNLHVYGDGPQRAALERMAERCAVVDRVQFLGSRPRADILSAFASAEVLLFPTLHDAAGWAVAEALDAGCPVVCLDVGGPATLVGPEDGVVVPCTGDVVGGLARGLSRARGMTPSGGRWSAGRLPALLDELYSAAEADVAQTRARSS